MNGLLIADDETLIRLHSIGSALDVLRAMEEALEIEAPAPLVALGSLLAIFPTSELARPARLDRAARNALIVRAAVNGPPARLARAWRELRHVSPPGGAVLG